MNCNWSYRPPFLKQTFVQDYDGKNVDTTHPDFESWDRGGVEKL